MFTNNVKFFQKAVVFHPLSTRFLILKRVEHDTSAPGQWDFPGGGIDFGELHLAALEREIWEETGLTIVNQQVIEVMTRFDASRQIYSIFVAHQCQATHAEVRLSEEHTAYRWVTASEWAQMDAPPSLKQVVARLTAVTNDGVLEAQRRRDQ
ncbi:MAG: NUDIX domain-containing protein [Caldilineaceae bacterium]